MGIKKNGTNVYRHSYVPEVLLCVLLHKERSVGRSSDPKSDLDPKSIGTKGRRQVDFGDEAGSRTDFVDSNLEVASLPLRNEE